MCVFDFIWQCFKYNRFFKEKGIMIRIFIHIILLALLTSSCSLTKHVPEGELLYTGSSLDIRTSTKEINTNKLENTAYALLSNPSPNKRFLGIRWRLRFYNMFYTQKEKGLFSWLQEKLGEEPVLYDEQLALQTARLLEDLSFNEGFFHASADSDVKKTDKKAKVLYQLSLTEPYTIVSFSNQITDSLIYEEVEKAKKQSLIQPGMRYELSRLKSERERITSELKKKGLYFFQDDFLKFRADITGGNRQIKLVLSLKPEVAKNHLKPQTINRLIVFPDFEFGETVARSRDTTYWENMIFVYKELLVEPAALQKAILLKPGKQYAPEDHLNTLRRLSLLSIYQFVDMQYDRSPLADSLLDAKVYLTPRMKYNIEGSAGVSLQSGAYIGPEFSLTLSDRNFRNLADQLRLQAFGNFNIPLLEEFELYQKFGVGSQWLRQGLAIPFRRKPIPESVLGQTRIGLDFRREQVRLPLKSLRADLEEQNLDELLTRLDADSTFAPYARINRLDATYTYQWIKRPDIRHELTPLQIILQDANFEEQQVRDFLATRENFSSAQNGFLNLERMLIFKPNYTITYDSRLKQLRRHNYFNRSKIAFSGNILLTKEVLFSRQSLQTLFLQLENDWRYYFRVYDRQTFAFRFASSIAIPFRQDEVLPFIDLYNVGGANSIRAFPPRRLGPGSVEPQDETFFLSSNGDFKLEGSVEWRQKISPLFEFAAFLDAGNVWNLQGDDRGMDDAVFRWDNFYKQIALGMGVGLRLDFEVLLLRLDFAFPLSIPWLPEGERWVGNKIDLTNSQWRKDNLNFSLAFGYPF